MNKLFKSKKFIFLEKDYDCPSSRDSIDSAKMFLDVHLQIPEKIIESMEIHFSIGHYDREKMYGLIFNPNNIIVTFSVYVQGSDAIFFNLMGSAGTNDIKGMTYIDTSGSLKNFLDKRLCDCKNWDYVSNGINRNNIITIDYKDLNSKPQLLKIFPNGYSDMTKLFPLTKSNIL